MENLEFENKVVVVTGAAQGIGKCIADMFLKEKAIVCTIDIKDNPYFQGDLKDKNTLELFAKKVIDDYGHIDFLINNATPLFSGLTKASYEDFEAALKVGVTAPFYLTKLFAPYFAKDAAIVNISSTRDRMSQPESESYSAAKGGIYSLTHALAMTLAGKVRVNSISPGWIDSYDQNFDGLDASQHPVKRVGKKDDIANMVLFLCSSKAGFITGENICIDGGMTKQMIYHNDFNWTLND